jgi:ABC-type lipoprotein release transport system permease subunit
MAIQRREEEAALNIAGATGLLYGVSATSGWSLLAASVAVMFVSFVAAIAPARRAARIQPVDALRQG